MSEQYSIHLTKSVKKSIKNIPALKQKRLLKAILNLQIDPLCGKKLNGELEGMRKLRVWPYRIIYAVDVINKVVVIHKAEHRQGIYK